MKHTAADTARLAGLHPAGHSTYGSCKDCGRKGDLSDGICSEIHRIPACIKRREKRERQLQPGA